MAINMFSVKIRREETLIHRASLSSAKRIITQKLEPYLLPGFLIRTRVLFLVYSSKRFSYF